MQFQILDANYSYDQRDGLPLVQLFGVTEEGRSVSCKVAGFRPYFYAGVEEGMIDSVRKEIEEMGLQADVVQKFEPVGYQTQPSKMLEVITKDPKSVRVLRERVKEVPGVRAVYETDILFRNRFLIDRGMGGMGWVETVLPEWAGSREPPVLPLASVRPVQRETNAPFRYMAFDIECLPKKGEMPTSDVSPIILISMAFEPPYKGQKDLVLVGKTIDCPRDDVTAFKDEKAMIEAFGKVISDYDPDVISGYNCNDFDFPYIDERVRRTGAILRPGRDGSTLYIKNVVSTSNTSITGRVVVDVLPLIRSSFSLKQYTLRNVASQLLKMEKYDVDPKEIEGLWASAGEGLVRFISYSRRDAVLALRLLQDLRLMDKYIALSRASGALLQDVVNGGQSGMVESLLLRRFRDRNRVVPPKPGADESDERYVESDDLKGGAVLEPEKGLQEDVVILDYKSLYPTIMMAHNLCYSTVLEGPVQGLGEDDVIRSPSGGEFVPPDVYPGIVPGVLKQLLDERTQTKRLMKQAGEDERRFLDAKQYAMKILLNSFYGYSGYARARLYSQTVANAVTSFGRENLIKTRELIDGKGTVYVSGGEALFEDEIAGHATGDAAGGAIGGAIGEMKRFQLSVVYGDTDSVFVRLVPYEGEVSLADAEVIGRKIAKTVTASLPDPMELVFEAFARRAIFLTKKRYALWVFERSGESWKDKIKVRGMETVRRDWCGLTSKTLNRCLELVLKEGRVDDAVDHVRSVLKRIDALDLSKDPDILDDLTLTRRYTKSTASYKNKQPHIQLVEKMKRRGGRVPEIGDRVPFVIVSGCRAPKGFGALQVDTHHAGRDLFVDKAEDPAYALQNNLCIDTEYYIEKQILPPVLRILAAFGITKERLGEGGVAEPAARKAAPKQKSLFDF